MKSVGIVRKLDNLGKIVLPKELRDALGIAINDTFEFYSEGDAIILKKYEPFCTFCGNSEAMSYFRERKICGSCRQELKNTGHSE